MTDLYDHHIDAMKARERGTRSGIQAINARWWWRDFKQNARNADRLAAYKRKRAILDAAATAHALPEYSADDMAHWINEIPEGKE